MSERKDVKVFQREPVFCFFVFLILFGFWELRELWDVDRETLQTCMATQVGESEAGGNRKVFWHKWWCVLVVALFVLSRNRELHVALSLSLTHTHTTHNTHVSLSILKSLLNPVAKNVCLCCLFNVVFLFLSSAEGLCGYCWLVVGVCCCRGRECECWRCWPDRMCFICTRTFVLMMPFWLLLLLCPFCWRLMWTRILPKKIFFCWFLEKKMDQIYSLFLENVFLLFFLNYSNEELNSPSLGFRTSINFKRCSFYVFQKHELAPFNCVSMLLFLFILCVLCVFCDLLFSLSWDKLSASKHKLAGFYFFACCTSTTFLKQHFCCTSAQVLPLRL